jgi:hypothetical protein
VGVEIAVVVAQNLPVIQAAAAGAVAKIATGFAVASAAVQAVLPYAKAGALNTFAGTPFGASLGYPNQVGVARGGNLQPRTADGHWASSASNPGAGAALASNRVFQGGVGLLQGFVSGYHGTPSPGASTAIQQKAQEIGKSVGELVDGFQKWFQSSPED